MRAGRVLPPNRQTARRTGLFKFKVRVINDNQLFPLWRSGFHAHDQPTAFKLLEWMEEKSHLLQEHGGHAAAQADPFFATTSQVLESWFLIIAGADEDRTRAQAAWPAALEHRRLMPKKTRWQGITGVMSATIAALLDIG